ncbi:hypothetical protein BVG79_01906 [Ketogulonicigenium robustum]|uniref:Uncharacterized protein n=1 Tax=Ketogulonicigenium robustum TaxID=92947 RepID=A0A1W6P154_9RHOB|nr:esterase [Ketogulonicigenium robustum]ARO15248.1 hypothetical protein BVG79_01906 [Ketogulonicigenium robustum]
MGVAQLSGDGAAGRAAFRDSTDACRASVIAPRDDLGLPAALRSGLAARMCTLIGQGAMATHYAAGLDGIPAQIAAGASADSIADGAVAAMVRHCDKITQTPGEATRADIDALVAAGLTVPQVVALSELVAFTNYETRIRQGHALLEV